MPDAAKWDWEDIFGAPDDVGAVLSQIKLNDAVGYRYSSATSSHSLGPRERPKQWKGGWRIRFADYTPPVVEPKPQRPRADRPRVTATFINPVLRALQQYGPMNALQIAEKVGGDPMEIDEQLKMFCRNGRVEIV
jgi:hypothetical protein